jgi:hypothetical protein
MASKSSKSLDIPNFIEVFEPIQTAVGARGGPERVQAMQATVELRPSDVALHTDVTDAYPSVDRGLMLNEVYVAPLTSTSVNLQLCWFVWATE